MTILIFALFRLVLSEQIIAIKPFDQTMMAMTAEHPF